MEKDQGAYGKEVAIHSHKTKCHVMDHHAEQIFSTLAESKSCRFTLLCLSWCFNGLSRSWGAQIQVWAQQEPCIWYHFVKQGRFPRLLPNWFWWEDGTSRDKLLAAAAFHWCLHGACSEHHALPNATVWHWNSAYAAAAIKKKVEWCIRHGIALGMEHRLCSPLVKLGGSRFLTPDVSEGSALTTSSTAREKENKLLKNPASFLFFFRQYSLKVWGFLGECLLVSWFCFLKSRPAWVLFQQLNTSITIQALHWPFS